MKAFVRSIFCGFVLGTFGVCAMFLDFFVLPIAKLFMGKTDYMYFVSDLIHFTWRNLLLNLMLVLRLIKLDIKNLSELENIQNKVIVATHPSFIDVVILIALIPRTTCLVKQELAKNPIISNLVKSIFIINDIEIEEFKKETKNMLDLGFNVIVFPTGTRHKRTEIPKIKKGASLISINADKDIAPVQIFSDGEFMFINRPFYYVDKRIVVFEVKKLDDISVKPYENMDKIKAKRELTQKIANVLYNENF